MVPTFQKEYIYHYPKEPCRGLFQLIWQIQREPFCSTYVKPDDHVVKIQSDLNLSRVGKVEEEYARHK